MAIHTINKPNYEEKYSIIIPAAGMGKRMRSYGPKPLLKLTSHLDIITNQLNIIYDAFKYFEIILVAGFEADKLMNNTPQNLIKIENERYEETNVLRSIGLGLRAATTTNVLIIYGDLVFTKNLFRNCVLQNQSKIFINSSNLMQDEIGCTINQEKSPPLLEHMCYTLPKKWAQILFVTGDELKLLQRIAWNRNKEKLFGFEAINEIVECGGKIITHSNSHINVVDVDTSKDLNNARQLIHEFSTVHVKPTRN